MDFLSEIISVKRQRIESAKTRQSIDQMRELAHRVRSGSRRLRQALGDKSSPNIIAEFKRRSPSKGRISPHADPAVLAQTYEAAGAAAISVLTEEDYFDGSLGDLRRVRQSTSLPILRKDFIVDDYQLYESAAAGADALLLIVAALDDQTLARLRGIAEDELGMDALVEVHTKAEFDRAFACGARLIGVNNRDLRTFEVSTTVSTALARFAPPSAVLVSESGLTPGEVRELRKIGYSGFLVGETLMRSADPAQTIRELIGEPEPLSSRSAFVKICGITNLGDARAAIDAGADMLGFNFYSRSPRFIEPAVAREIIGALRLPVESNKATVKMVGVFVNESPQKVFEIADAAGLDGLQFHGDESIDYCQALRQRTPKAFLLKAIRPNVPMDFASLSRYPVDAFMLDAYDTKLHGGTGRLADWGLARDAAQKLPRLFLAGGLSPVNVAEAIGVVRPYAVDACSALEVSPGKKDHARVREFVAAVRASKLPIEASVA